MRIQCIAAVFFSGLIFSHMSISCAQTHQSMLNVSAPSTEVFDKNQLDQLIKQREEKTLNSLKASAFHRDKSIAELIDLARVGKMNSASFKRELSSVDKDFGQPLNDASVQEMFGEYKRIWYLADDAYSPLSLRKFNPDKKLIPYLNNALHAEQRFILKAIFAVELARESHDPRALGHECSEMLKLRAIVDSIE